MDLCLQNQLSMVGACITVAQSSDYKPVWNGQDPADFGTDLVKLETDYGAVTAKGAQADAATGGTADAKAVAETALEDAGSCSPARAPITSRKPATSTATARWT
jgi:hypothetical protein